MVLLEGQLGGPTLLVSSSCCSILELTNQLSRNLKSSTTTTTTTTTTTRHVSSCLHCSFRPCVHHVRRSKLPFRPSRNLQQSRDCVHCFGTRGGWQLLEHVRLFFYCVPRRRLPSRELWVIARSSPTEAAAPMALEETSPFGTTVISHEPSRTANGYAQQSSPSSLFLYRSNNLLAS